MEQAPNVPKMQVVYLEAQGQGELTSISILNQHVARLRLISSGWEWGTPDRRRDTSSLLERRQRRDRSWSKRNGGELTCELEEIES